MIDREALERAAREFAWQESRAYILATSDSSGLHHVSDADWEEWQPNLAAAITAYLDAMKAKGWEMKPREPTPAMVWAVCPYLRPTSDCTRCQIGDVETAYGPGTRGCYVLAEEAYEMAFSAAPEPGE